MRILDDFVQPKERKHVSQQPTVLAQLSDSYKRNPVGVDATAGAGSRGDDLQDRGGALASLGDTFTQRVSFLQLPARASPPREEMAALAIQAGFGANSAEGWLAQKILEQSAVQNLDLLSKVWRDLQAQPFSWGCPAGPAAVQAEAELQIVEKGVSLVRLDERTLELLGAELRNTWAASTTTWLNIMAMMNQTSKKTADNIIDSVYAGTAKRLENAQAAKADEDLKAQHALIGARNAVAMAHRKAALEPGCKQAAHRAELLAGLNRAMLILQGRSESNADATVVDQWLTTTK